MTMTFGQPALLMDTCDHLLVQALVTDRPVLPWPYQMILRGGVMVLEGAGILARGTGSCT